MTGSVHFHRIPLLLCGGQTVGSKSGSRDQPREGCSQLGGKDDDLAHTYGKKWSTSKIF